MKTAGIFLLVASAAFSQTMRKPASREHVKIINGVATKFTSKLATIVELNFTMNNGHQPGKLVITTALTRIAVNYGGLTVNKFTTASDGSVRGVVPNFTVTDLMAGQVIVANNISFFGEAAVGTAKQSAVQTTIETNGRGYLGFHGSGDNQATGWPWFTSTLHPMSYQGHENRSLAPVYKHLPTARHMIMDSILFSATTAANVPNELDGAGAEVVTTTPVPTRRMMNEWYRFGRDISRDAAYSSRVTTLLKYDPRALGTSELDPEYKRRGGNLYTYLYKVGAGMTSFIPAGHENDELLAPTTGFDGGVGDFDRYVAQTLFFLAGYNQTTCDVSCNGLAIADTSNLLTGDKYVATSVGGKAIAIHQDLTFNSTKLGFSSTFEKKYNAKVTDLHGRVIFHMTGKGRVNHEFDTSKLKPGVYFLTVQIGSAPAQARRYALLPTSR